MAETIGSLGGVPLGKSGTGRAVTFAKEDYKYLYPEKKKEEKYKPLVSDQEIAKFLKETGEVWKPDQQQAKDKFDSWYKKVKEIELLNSTGSKAEAQKKREELRSDEIDIINFLKNSHTHEKNGLAYEDDKKNNPLLYDDSDDLEYQSWLAKPVEQRELNPKINKGTTANYVGYVIPTMEKLMEPTTEQETKIRGGVKDTKRNVFYTDEQIYDAAKKATSLMEPGGKWMNYWKTMMLNYADDPNTPENESEIAANILASIGPGGTSPEFVDFVTNENVKLFSGNKEKITKIKAPDLPRAGRTGGGGGRAATVSLVTGVESIDVYDAGTDKLIRRKGSYPTIAIGEDKDSQLQYVVDSRFVNQFVKENPWAGKVFRQETRGGQRPSYAVKGDATSIVYDPNTKQEYIQISTKDANDNLRVFLIPNNLANEATLEAKWKKTDEAKSGGTFKDYRKKYYQSVGGGAPGAPAAPPASGAPSDSSNLGRWQNRRRGGSQ